MMEDDMTLGGGSNAIYRTCIMECTLETSMIFLTNVTQIKLIKRTHNTRIHTLTQRIHAQIHTQTHMHTLACPWVTLAGSQPHSWDAPSDTQRLPVLMPQEPGSLAPEQTRKGVAKGSLTTCSPTCSSCLSSARLLRCFPPNSTCLSPSERPSAAVPLKPMSQIHRLMFTSSLLALPSQAHGEHMCACWQLHLLTRLQARRAARCLPIL